MIAVVGLPAWAGAPDGEGSAGGLAVEVAVAARKRGATVELVGKIGDDGAGDAVVVSLGRLGIGHAALLRDPTLPTPLVSAQVVDELSGADELTSAVVGLASDEGESAAAVVRPVPAILPENAEERPGLDAADVDLALRYLARVSVIVIADPLPAAAVVAGAQAAAFSGARLIVLVPAGGAAPAPSSDAIVLETPDRDDGSFGRLVGIFAGGLEAGLEPGDAFREAVDSAGWERVGP